MIKSTMFCLLHNRVAYNYIIVNQKMFSLLAKMQLLHNPFRVRFPTGANMGCGVESNIFPTTFPNRGT